MFDLKESLRAWLPVLGCAFHLLCNLRKLLNRLEVHRADRVYMRMPCEFIQTLAYKALHDLLPDYQSIFI